MARLGWVLFIVMTMVSGFMAYKFIYSGQTEVASDKSPDQRTAIILENFERDFMLGEMRNFLIGLQQILEGIEKDDMSQVVAAARKVGSADLEHVPGSLMGKLPLAFKKMGLSTHKAFDQMAMDAEQLGDKEYTLSQLNKIIPTCTACHALYKVR